ncbi:MAG: hypothetical protein IJ834_04685 [Paludibacteraceae bacterium]|nr:hypothetical protein [Paludibacteraceae bacterium]
MVKKIWAVILLFSCACMYSQIDYTQQMYPLIVQDIYESLIEEDKEVDFEDISENLLLIHENPINLNDATYEELSQLMFLSDEQIDDILLLVYQHPLESVWELRLVSSLEDYEVRNLLPFVVVKPVEKDEKIYWKEMWHYAKHEVDTRFDARSIEDNGNDPFYLSIKYKFNYKKKVEWGIVADRDPKEPFYYPHKTYGADFYGGYLQLTDIWKFQKIVAGDFRASFGHGLVLNNSSAYGGKVSYLTNNMSRKEGLRRKTSTAEYDFMRGVGATIRLGKVDLSALYSARKVDGAIDEEGYFPSIQKTGYHRTTTELDKKRTVWQQVAALNVTYRSRIFRLGLTASGNFFNHTLKPKSNYYNKNYFSGRQQLSVGANYAVYKNKWSVSGEWATSSNIKWGFAIINQVKYTPISGVSLTAIYRYYSPHYDNLLASSFGETSKANDENGLMIGTVVSKVGKLRISAFADVFYFSQEKYRINKTNTIGYELYGKAEYEYKQIGMQWLVKNKLKGDLNKTSLRYAISSVLGQWKIKAIVEGNLIYNKEKEAINLGGVVAPQVEYAFEKVPIVLQARAEAFYIKNYDNRIYLYENDVLYAFSIPMIYGTGGRWLLNFRYRISDRVSFYLKLSQTIWSKSWQESRHYATMTRTELHSLLRIKI